MYGSRYDPGPWNLVVVARTGMTARCVSRLSPVVRLRSTRYPAVLAALVDGRAADAVARLWAERPELFDAAERVVPVEESMTFERDDVTERLCEALEGPGERLAGSSFHVRARLRGLKGRIEHQAVERALGAFLLERAVAAGAAGRVRFEDPDVIVAVEVLGCTVGYGFLDRTSRSSPLVRVR